MSALPGRGRRQQPCGEREDYWIGGCPESTSLLLIPSGNLFFSLFFFKREMLNIFVIMWMTIEYLCRIKVNVEYVATIFIRGVRQVEES